MQNLMTIDAAAYMAADEMAELSIDQLELLHDEAVERIKQTNQIKKAIVSAAIAKVKETGVDLPNTGTVTAEIGDTKVTVTVPKSVAWDQGKLRAFEDDIESWGHSVSDYMDVKRTISETKFNAWPEKLQSMVIGARTVKSGQPSIKFKTEG